MRGLPARGRTRRRGPPSYVAIMRRICKSCRAPSAQASGESDAVNAESLHNAPQHVSHSIDSIAVSYSSESQQSIFHDNVRSTVSHSRRDSQISVLCANVRSLIKNYVELA